MVTALAAGMVELELVDLAHDVLDAQVVHHLHAGRHGVSACVVNDHAHDGHDGEHGLGSGGVSGQRDPDRTAGRQRQRQLGGLN